MTWEMILGMNMSDDPLLTEMQEGIREALDAGEDPGPAVAFALVREMTERQELKSTLNSVATYVLKLETRLVESGIRFAQADERILGA